VQQHQAVEGSGWLLGDDVPVIVEREAATTIHIPLAAVIPIDVRQSVQLTLF